MGHKTLSGIISPRAGGQSISKAASILTTDYENFHSGFCLENVQLISYLH